MQPNPRQPTSLLWRLQRALLSTTLGLLVFGAGSAVGEDLVYQSPLQVPTVSVPGNLAIVASLEFPTMVSVANFNAGSPTADYASGTTWTGYFDSAKCYDYHYSAVESERHFYPIATPAPPNCNGHWSGNYLNWATTQTADPFRKALTGGYRAKDTTTETWLEKTWSDGQGTTGTYNQSGSINFRQRRINGSTAVSAATPMNWTSFYTRVLGIGNKMYFTKTGTLGTSPDPSSGISPTPIITYNPASALDSSKIYALSVRVKVCDASVGLEPNCVQYGSNWKPEGLIQKNAKKIKFSAFGYLGDGRRYNAGTDSSTTRDGGVMRARNKFVGPTLGDTDEDNEHKEWDPATGIFVQNPDPDDASETQTNTGQTVEHSGVINFINKTGQIIPDALYKRYDPVSELYYSAIRYFKNQGYVPQHATISGTEEKKQQLVDGLPVITDWADPIEYWCQKNIILGIGDTNTQRDKNLPGPTSGTNEPTKPSVIASDTSVNVIQATNKIASLEGISINNSNFSGSDNSAFIAGLAYDSHTRDIRDDLEEKQTISTYWVDVLEFETLKAKAQNQYWLAAKYGGFTAPEDFDPYTYTGSLPTDWWHTTSDVLSTGDLRPDHFYTAARAEQLITSLTQAFADITQELLGSGASLASNSTKLETGTRTFQAQFYSGTWRGELNAYDVDLDTGELGSTPVWRASNMMPAWGSRNIKVNNPGNGMVAFEFNNLSGDQTTKLVSEEVVNYLRGDASKEAPNGVFRKRSSLLGDIVHSQPVYIAKPNAGLFAGANFSGADTYGAFATAQASRTPTIYVGANDGMLHGFNATTGVETFAFIPNQAIMNDLQLLGSPEYEHRYFVDGELTVADVYVSGGWKTILVGTLGRGGPGIFALDVTNPASVGFLWEKNATDIPALGRNIGKPVIAQVADGDWRVLLGNGPDNADGKAQLVMVEIEGGTVHTADTAVADTNGLSAVYTWDSDADGFMDTAYAGDLKGNLWKFTGLAGTPSMQKLFEAKDPDGDAQPITAAPLAGRNPDTAERWVFFGTGIYLGRDDLTNQQVQTWYGLIDSGTPISGRGQLMERSILNEGVIGDFSARTIEEAQEGDMEGKKGWFMDLISPVNGAEGERMVVPNQFMGRVLIGTTRIPDQSDLCRPTGRGFIMAINPFTGARLDQTFFDINQDGLFNEQDKLNDVIVSGIGFDSGPNNPIFIENILQVSLDDGSTKAIRTQGGGSDARRTSWREIMGN